MYIVWITNFCRVDFSQEKTHVENGKTARLSHVWLDSGKFILSIFYVFSIFSRFSIMNMYLLNQKNKNAGPSFFLFNF